MDTKTLLKERRSVNFFDKEKELDENVLKKIINLATLAPSAFNLQPWRIIAVKTPESKLNLFNLANKQEKVLEASINLIIIGDKDGYGDSNPVWTEMLESVGGKQEIVDGAKQAAAYLYGSSGDRKLKFAESNAGLLAMSIMITAKEYGVDSHPMSGLDFDGVHKAFGLKKDETVVMSICMGYADKSKTLYPRRARRSFEDITSIV